MSPVYFVSIAFVSGERFVFGSLSFFIGLDGRLHIFDQEVLQVGWIRADLAIGIRGSASKLDLIHRRLGAALPCRVGSATHSAQDVFLAVNAILYPFSQPEEEAESLLPLINSPECSDSSTRSWNPPRELYAITEGFAHSEGELKHREDDDSCRVAEAATEEE